MCRIEVGNERTGPFVAARMKWAVVMWAAEWFRSLGHEQYKPAVLMWCAHWWMSTYIAVSKAVTESVRPSYRSSKIENSDEVNRDKPEMSIAIF
jgi:hypothetical protein